MALSEEARSVIKSALGGMELHPSNLAKALDFYSEQRGILCTVAMLHEHLSIADPNDDIRQLATKRFQHWDFVKEAAWASGTAHNTRERRAHVYLLLALGDGLGALCDERIPVYIAEDPPIVIAEDHEPWYQSDDPGLQFYWPAYRDQLLAQGWSATSVETLGQATASVVERISNPSRVHQYQSKGLVVGYVQSGKTAHFTGVIARAADAGYRLFVILAGTMDILRKQTQRRIDKELIGQELVGEDYIDDEEWKSFVRHGGLPSLLGGFDWERLTGPEDDFQRLKFGIGALEFLKYDSGKPLYDPLNLLKSKARIMIIKKHPAIIGRVAQDLGKIKARLADIPTLVIDDESDLASVNTTNPSKRTKEDKARTATNLAIVDLLGQLPRSQYVGYTATPFANVFVDPSDAKDLFPKDFIVSLSRPEGYMGITDFHDLDDEKPGFQSNERAFVRGVSGLDADKDNLPKALDSFILSGALKLFREVSPSDRRFRHHTMLVHVSHLVADQEAMAQEIEDLFENASYHSGAAFKRLQLLWQEDFAPVSVARGDGATPDSFEDLLPHLGDCLSRVQDGKRVLVVNGTPEADTPDFDRRPIWKILCGGAKLSRGYTIEGLTISYYRRHTNAADTLMQMGRWFGFRAGYRDLVRLFIGRAEPNGKADTFDLYKAFEAVCRDELEFRQELRRYANLAGKDRITPKQVPPLVPAHLLRPTASNKMYNAVLRFKNFGEQYKEPTLAPTDHLDIVYNEMLMVELIKKAKVDPLDLSLEPGNSFKALVAILSPVLVLDFLKSYRWSSKRHPLHHEIEFLGGKHGDPGIDEWVFLAPQMVQPEHLWTASGIDFSSPYRQKTDATGRFDVYSEPKHRAILPYIARVTENKSTANSNLRQLRVPRRGVFLFYPAHNPVGVFTMGFALQFPQNSIQTPVVWGVRDPGNPDEVIVVIPTK